MLSLSKLIISMVMVCVFACLPTTTQCDTSYYEKYYSARRFIPLKRTSLLSYNFTVKLNNEALATFERVALVGDLKQLGGWRAQDAILLNRTEEYNVWTASLQLPLNTSVNYRYFIAAIDNAAQMQNVQVRRWETHITARNFNISTEAGNRIDVFGWMGEGEGGKRREVQRGWLHAGRIVQFKVYRKPLHIDESVVGSSGASQIRMKLQPIEPHSLTPILSSARAYTEYVSMSYGDSFLRPQPEFGVPYNNNDILIFHTTVSELHKVAFRLQLYATSDDSNLVRFIGYQYLYPDTLQGSEGNISLKLISPVWMHTIGSLHLQYLVIAPLPNTIVDFRTSFAEYWRDNWTNLDIGHRGLGKSLKQATNAAPIIENTVASMKAAGVLGADVVEFDVQLTSDLVPIIYHDYMIYVCMHPKTPTNIDDLTQVLIKDVTYEQLKNLKTYQIINSKIVEYPAHNAVSEEDQRLFPLFEDFLVKVNKSLGFNIEIKWPQMMSNGVYESIQTIDKNTYIDRILDVMLQHGCGRLSFFSSFDADICSLVRFKQNMYPVMFLSSSVQEYYADPRSDTIYDSINNAQAFELAGIAPNGKIIESDPRWISIAMKQNKKVFIWGDSLKDIKTIEWFKAQHPTGVIYDRMDLWLPANKVNIFEQEPDLPEFFKLQCSTKSGDESSVGGNSTTEGSILSNVEFL